MHKKRLKLKKRVWIILVIIIFLIIGIIATIKIKNNYEYKQTSTYKLLEFGYSEDEIVLLKQYLNENELLDLLNANNKNKILINLMQEQYYNHDGGYHEIIFFGN